MSWGVPCRKLPPGQDISGLPQGFVEGIHCRAPESWDPRTFKPALSMDGFVPRSDIERRDGAKTGWGPWREGQALPSSSGPGVIRVLIDNWALFFGCEGGLKVLWSPCSCPKVTPDLSRFHPVLLFHVFWFVSCLFEFPMGKGSDHSVCL